MGGTDLYLPPKQNVGIAKRSGRGWEGGEGCTALGLSSLRGSLWKLCGPLAPQHVCPSPYPHPRLRGALQSGWPQGQHDLLLGQFTQQPGFPLGPPRQGCAYSPWRPQPPCPRMWCQVLRGGLGLPTRAKSGLATLWSLSTHGRQTLARSSEHESRSQTVVDIWSGQCWWHDSSELRHLDLEVW